MLHFRTKVIFDLNICISIGVWWVVVNDWNNILTNRLRYTDAFNSERLLLIRLGDRIRLKDVEVIVDDNRSGEELVLRLNGF